MTDQQTVTDSTDEQAKPATEATGAPEKSVEDLLKEFDTQAEPKADAPKGDGRLDKILDFVETKAVEEANDRTNRDIKDAVTTAIGDSELDPEYVEGKLHYRANTDPQFRNAWLNRHEKPEQFKQVVRALGKEMASTMKSNVDQSVTDDRASVAAAVRSQSTKPADAPPSSKDIRKMSDAEFTRFKKGLRE